MLQIKPTADPKSLDVVHEGKEIGSLQWNSGSMKFVARPDIVFHPIPLQDLYAIFRRGQDIVEARFRDAQAN